MSKRSQNPAGGLFAGLLPLSLGLLKLTTSRNVLPEEAEAVIHFALSQGMRIFDTADCYFYDDEDLRYGEQQSFPTLSD